MWDEARAAATLAGGRERFDERAWRQAVEAFAAVDAERGLGAEDLERLAVAAYMSGLDDTSTGAMARAHDHHVAGGAPARAARCAFWLGMWASDRGERAHANGWFARAERVLADVDGSVAERGLLLMPAALRLAGAGDVAGAYVRFEEAVRAGEVAGDDDLTTLACQAQGRALLHMGHVARGIAYLDEAMLSVSRARVSPMVVGIVYCSVLDACREIGDVGRAREWTHELTVWCDLQPDLVPFRGPCLVHRSEVARLTGAWDEALSDADRARGQLAGPPPRPGAGAAHAQWGDLLRLRGRFDEAADAYARAIEAGWAPQPGLALLHLAVGRPVDAYRELELVLLGVHDPVRRARLLPALVETALAAGEMDAARAASGELMELAARLDTPMLQGFAWQADAAVALADGDPAAGLHAAREAGRALAQLELPFETARARVLEARAQRALGRADAAAALLRAAKDVFDRLGAVPAARELAALEVASPERRHGLTAREVEVVRQVVTGASNKAMAARLAISERTVERHLSNVFAKLGVRTRAEVSAFAVRHGLG